MASCRRSGAAPSLVARHAPFLLTVFLLLSAPPAAAQGAPSVRGVVRTDDGRPVKGAEVRLGDSARTLTGESGTFRFSGVPPGEHTLRVDYLGFETERRRIRVATDESRRVSVTLNRDVIEVAEIVVQVPRDRRARVRSMFDDLIRQHGHLLTRREIDRRNPFRTSDLLRRVPDVYVRGLRDGGFGNRVVVRCAGRSTEPTVYLNGGRVPGLGIDQIPPEQIAALGVVTGPAITTVTRGCGAVFIVTRDMLLRGRPGPGR